MSDRLSIITHNGKVENPYGCFEALTSMVLQKKKISFTETV